MSLRQWKNTLIQSVGKDETYQLNVTFGSNKNCIAMFQLIERVWIQKFMMEDHKIKTKWGIFRLTIIPILC